MKKLLCIMLAVTLMAGMAMSAGAAVVGLAPGPVLLNTGVLTTGIKAINESKAIGSLINPVVTVNDGKDGRLSLSDLSELEIAPGDVIKIPISGALFLDANGNYFSQSNVSLSALTSAGIGVKASFTKGEASYTASIGGNKSGSYIKIQFAEGIYITPQKFTSYITLSKNGARKISTRINITGEMQTRSKELASGTDYADLSGGIFVTPKAPLRNVEIYLGDYCTITRNLSRNVSYAGTATIDDINAQDIVVLNKHPNVEYIYKLKTVGLKTTGNIVTFDFDDNYYVYNTNGVYIGRSNQALPFWTKYYLSTKKYEKIITK